MPTPRQRAVTAPTAVEPYLNRRAGYNFWKLCSPVVLEPRDGQAELITLKAKPVPGMEASYAKHRQGQSFRAHAEGSSRPLLTGEPPPPQA